MNQKNIKILVTDDEEDIVEILTYNLEKAGYFVVKASNGLDCLKVAALELPDLIILDIRMPGLNGIDTCRQLRTIEALKRIPVLFLTADSDEFTSMRAFDAGGDHFITKPIKPSILVNMINELLG